MMSTVEEILKGAIDMHVHSCPEISAAFKSARYKDIEQIEHAKELGIRGYVMKSHTFNTIGKAGVLEQFIDGFEIFGSVTLNKCNGGLDLLSVELAASLGCKVIWLPTYSAKFDIEANAAKGLMSPWLETAKALDPEKDGITVWDENGNVKQIILDIMKMCMKKDMVLFTGHFSAKEGLALCKAAHDMGYKKLVYCHPAILGGTEEMMEQALEYGATVEFTEICMEPFYCVENPNAYLDMVVRLINKYGPDHIILDSDHFDTCHPEAEMMRAWVAVLLKKGVPGEIIHKMIADNPAKLLGLDAA